MMLSQDIILDDSAVSTASQDMNDLAERAEKLKSKLTQMYNDLTKALDTPAGRQLELTAKDVLIKPIEDLLLVIRHTSDTLTEIIGTGYYKSVFIKYEELNQSIKM